MSRSQICMARIAMPPSSRRSRSYARQRRSLYWRKRPSHHKAFADHTLTCHQPVDAYLERIAAFDQNGPKLNALITVNPKVRATADALDSMYRADPAKVGPLHCIPILLKDNYDTADMRTTGGSLNPQGIPATA